MKPQLLLIATLIAAGAVARSPQRVDARAQFAGNANGEWLTYGLDYAETRYSPLKQIDAENVSRLKLAWSADIGTGGGGQEATPLVSGGVIYGITNWSVTFAIDARTGKELWRWDPEVNHALDDPQDDSVCCGPVNRGLGLYQDRLIVPVIDGRLASLDKKTGRVMWSVQALPAGQKYTFTMAPRVVKDKIIVGSAGGEFFVRGYFSAYDANSGKEVWRFYTVPGDPSKPFENEAMRKAAKTWSGEWWKLGGGGTVWDGLSYDPDLDLIYVGTGNGTPWPEVLRGSEGMDNLYICSILAVKLETGELVWYYQAVPGDEWDYDNVQQLTLADLRINGRQRKVVMQATKGGIFYVIDRTNGEFISAAPFAKVNWTSGFDPKTGRPMINAEARYGTKPVRIFPSSAHSWAPMAFNPTTGLTYFPASLNSSSVFAVNPDFVPKPGLPPVVRVGVARVNGVTPSEPPSIGPEPVQGQRGSLLAWDPVSQRERWRADGGGGGGGGVMTTAGNMVFQVRGDGHLLVYRASDGNKLADIETGLRGGMGPPITFEVDGSQYIAFMGNTGGGQRGAAPQGPEASKLLVFTVN